MTDRGTSGEGGWGSGANRLLVLALSLVLVLSGLEPIAGMAEAVAQERPRTIMEMLFGPSTRRERPIRGYDDPQPVWPQKPKPPRKPKPKPDRTAKTAPADAADPATAGSDGPVEKSPTAKTVLVVGDFMAGSLASGLVESFKANPGVRVESAADGSSGLVRDDHFDWIQRIGPMIDEKKPAVVVVMVGSNDRQTLTLGSSSLTPRSPEWVAEYDRRAAALAAAVAAKSVPLVWVGMPSFKFDRMSADMAFLNELYRKASGSVGGDFVDVWDGFVDETGAFSYSGPDVAGQPSKLRNSDGITMTPDGAEKLAFFAEKPIFRLLGTSAMPDPSGLPAGVETARTDHSARPANAASAPLVSVGDPALDGGDTLLGDSANVVVSAEPSPRERLVVSGEPLAAPAGRADSFNWSGKTEAVSRLRGTADVISRGSVELQKLRQTEGIKPPKDMPSLADAIIADWEAQNAAEAAAKAKAVPATAPTPAAPASAPESAATAAPISASPFPSDQKPL